MGAEPNNEYYAYFIFNIYNQPVIISFEVVSDCYMFRQSILSSSNLEFLGTARTFDFC